MREKKILFSLKCTSQKTGKTNLKYYLNEKPFPHKNATKSLRVIINVITNYKKETIESRASSKHILVYDSKTQKITQE